MATTRRSGRASRPSSAAQVAALEQQQAAIAEVLRIISRGPAHLDAALSAVLDSAIRLAGALWGSILQVDGERLRTVAVANVPGMVEVEGWRPIGPGTLVGTAVLQLRIVHVFGTD